MNITLPKVAPISETLSGDDNHCHIACHGKALCGASGIMDKPTCEYNMQDPCASCGHPACRICLDVAIAFQNEDCACLKVTT